MAGARLVLFDDLTARHWQPLTSTRPAGELRFGALTLRERAERVFRTTCIGYITADDLQSFDEPGAPPVLNAGKVPSDHDVLFLSSRAVPAWTAAPIEFDDRAELVTSAGQAVGWFAPSGAEPPPSDFFEAPDRHAPDVPARPIDGQVLDHIWQLVTRNADQLERDIAALFPAGTRPPLPAGVHVIGDAPLVVGEGAVIEPGTVFDLRAGPVWLDAGSTAAAFTKVTGPSYVGRGSTLLGGPFTAVSIGPVCKVHGEMEQAVVLGYSNKAHDGFLGHAYLGCWVNLGAMTTNSDLKNNYGPIRVWTPHGEIDTQEIKLGCIIGDHVKTAIGTLLNTGTVIGTGSNLFGSGIPPKYVPPFSWGWDDPSTVFELERFLASAELVMHRRDLLLSAGQRELLRRLWQRTGGAR